MTSYKDGYLFGMQLEYIIGYKRLYRVIDGYMWL